MPTLETTTNYRPLYLKEIVPKPKLKEVSLSRVRVVSHWAQAFLLDSDSH